MRAFLSFVSTMFVFGFGVLGWAITRGVGSVAVDLWRDESYVLSVGLFLVAWCGLGSGFFIGIGVARWALPRIELRLELLRERM